MPFCFLWMKMTMVVVERRQHLQSPIGVPDATQSTLQVRTGSILTTALEVGSIVKEETGAHIVQGKCSGKLPSVRKWWGGLWE